MAGTTISGRLLAHKGISRCWAVCQPTYHAFLRQTIFRHGARKRVANRFHIRVCFENRRTHPSAQYDREVPWLLNSIRPEMTVLDVGANIGLISIILGLHLSRGRVFAFEPSPFPFRCLQENIRLNHVEQTVVPLPYAVGEQPGSIPFFTNEDPCDTQHSPLRPPGTQLTKTEVRCVSIDSFCQEHSLCPDCIKIDVEGYEPAVLRGAQRTLAENPNLIVFVELHPFAWSHLGYDEVRFRQLLDDLHLTADGPDACLDANHVRLVSRR